MSEKKGKQPHIEAIIIAGIAVSAFFVVVSLLLIRQQKLQPQEGSYLSDISNLTSDSVATIGQNYIKTLASYNLGGNEPILLKEADLLGEGRWLVKFEVVQNDDFARQVYNYQVEILDGHVVRHNVSVMGLDRLLLVANPEPEQVVAGSVLLVKGQLYPSSAEAINDQILVELLERKTLNVKLSETAAVKAEDDYTYLVKLSFPDYIAGEYAIRVSLNDNIVYVPLIITQKQ